MSYQDVAEPVCVYCSLLAHKPQVLPDEPRYLFGIATILAVPLPGGGAFRHNTHHVPCCSLFANQPGVLSHQPSVFTHQPGVLAE